METIRIDNRKRRVTVYLDHVLSDWLESKALEGYIKGAIVRRALHSYRERELISRPPHRKCGLGSYMGGPVRGASYDPDEPAEGDGEAE